MERENSEEGLKAHKGELRDLAVREVVKLCISGCSSREALLGALDKVLSHPYAACLSEQPEEVQGEFENVLLSILCRLEGREL